MSDPVQSSARILHNIRLARDTWRIRLECPAMAQAIRPGQFLMARLHGGSDPLLGRPFALYDTVLDASGNPVAIDVVYLVVGKMTSRLSELRAGDSVEIWGPLGNGFPALENARDIALVAGGIGQTPFLAYIRQLRGERIFAGMAPRLGPPPRVRLFYGVRSADYAAGVEDFRTAGAEVLLASDDGSLEFRGFVTQRLAQESAPEQVVGCGPEPMLHALVEWARNHQIPCHVSLETPMACGLGICFSCVTPIRTSEGGWDYKRVCIDGPVFNASALAWEPENR